ncbi:unnamed protein product [Cylicocyclus nassatus]|uniref:Uncharacterized protein n=1 Tax=Cylicocyclus nassatus TaxID=53992 RepID=A0AA36HBK6_CYLNA|nr:unnamed protein product [Cylicocyclus nassatus]
MDQQERKERFNETLAGRVMSEYIRIINIPIRMKKDLDLLMDDIKNLLGYDRSEDRTPFSWPRPFGVGSTTMGITRYNNENGTKILIMQEQTTRQTDLNRLCLLLRIQIKECYQNAKKRAPEIRIRHNKVEINGVGTYDPVVLCHRLKWKVPEWHGTPLEELMDLRSKKEQEAGSLVLGDLALPGLTAEEQAEERMLQANKETLQLTITSQ